MGKADAAVRKQAGPEQLAVVYRPLADLIPYARNSRVHSDAQIAQIAASIREFSFTNPVLTDELGGIIAGHGRVLAARQLGLAEVPTITLVGLSEVQKRAYVIADNKLALNAGWDEELLAVELQGLASEGYDALLTGFDQGEFDKLVKKLEAPAPPEEFPEYDENLATNCTCPKCGYEWSESSKG
jgi:ParB-like chromosome segregation protein Spo0J